MSGHLIDVVVPVALTDATRVLQGMGEPFTQLVGAIDEPGAPTKGLDWTLSETSVHVLQTLRVYRSVIAGEKEPETSVDDLPSLVALRNREEIEEEPERNPKVIASLLRDAIADVVQTADAAGSDRVAVFTSDYSATVTAAICGLVGELIVHGYDIARSVRAAWQVDHDAALIAAYAACSAMSLVLDPEAARDVDLCIEVRLRRGRPISIRVKDGEAWGEIPGARRSDAILSTDPMAFLLVGYGRTDPVLPLLKGKLLVWGRKPWTILKLDGLFKNP